jgi:DNA adenine methylase
LAKSKTNGAKNGSYQMINSAFKWIGGKSRLRKDIVAILPEHSCYVEPFAGAAWVLFGKPPSDVEILNDLDQELVSFFRVVKEKPEELIESFELDLVSRAEFDRLAELDTSKLTDVQRAHRFYYVIMAGWGGELNYPRFQTSTTDGGHGNRLIGALKSLRERVQPIHNRLRTVIIENLPWEACIDRYDRNNVVMYVDPPYPGNGCNYFHNMRDWGDHERLAKRLRESRCKWVVSSYDKEEIRNLFTGAFISVVQSASGMSIKKDDNTRVLNKEILISNYDPFKTPNHRKAHLTKEISLRKEKEGVRSLF